MRTTHGAIENLDAPLELLLGQAPVELAEEHLLRRPAVPSLHHVQGRLPLVERPSHLRASRRRESGRANKAANGTGSREAPRKRRGRAMPLALSRGRLASVGSSTLEARRPGQPRGRAVKHDRDGCRREAEGTYGCGREVGEKGWFLAARVAPYLGGVGHRP